MGDFNKNRSTLVLKSLGIIALAALGTAWWYQHFGPGYDAEFEAVRSELQDIPGVTILEMNCVHDDDIPFLPYIKYISARIEVEGAGKMTFTGLSRESFDSGGNIVIHSIGGIVPRYRKKGYLGAYKAATGEPTISEGFGGNLNIAPGGAFASRFPFEVSTIQTAVERYHEIFATVQEWPASPELPGHFTTADEIDYLYWTIAADKTEATDPLWNGTFSALHERVKNGSEES